MVILRASPGGVLAEGHSLIDLGCRGMKDSFVQAVDTVESPHRTRGSASQPVNAGAALATAHQANAWAEQSGFPPGRAWRDIQPFLAGIEPAPDVDVPLGLKGQPVLVGSEGDDARRLLATLNRNAGRGDSQ